MQRDAILKIGGQAVAASFAWAPASFAIAAADPLEGLTVASSVTQYGVTFTFSATKVVGQYANGDWWVLGPVSITSITPAGAVQTSGTDGDGDPITSREINGTMVNPGNRSFATGGLTANNTGNTVQAWDSLDAGVGVATPYNDAFNVDPGNTGSALAVTTGSVVKFVSKLTSLPTNNRPGGLDMAVLTVVDAIPATDAVRPGVSRTSKAAPCRAADFDLSIFQSLAPTANAPDYATALGWIQRFHETTQPHSINNIVAKAINNHPEYGRDIGNNIHRAMLCLHLSSFTDAQKRTLLCSLAAIADDLVSRAEEGGITPDNGGGNSWKKAVIVLCAASLGENTPASWTTWLSAPNNKVWCEGGQMFTVSGFDVALPRYTADGRPRSAFTYQMLGSAEWGEQANSLPNRNASNWDAAYRSENGSSLLGGTLAIELATGAKALWDDDLFWLYMDTAWHRRAGFLAGNTVLAFVEEMLVAYRPAKATVPALVEAGTKLSAIWLRYDHALDELATAPATSDFVVNVNGSPVTVSAVSVWRQNVGLTLAAPLSGSDTVTVSYTAGTNPVRSVDGVNAANLSAQAVTNTNDKVGGPNAAYPVVRFTSGVKRTLNGTAFAAADSDKGTAALLKFKFDAVPASDKELLGSTAGAVPFRIILRSNATIELRIRAPGGANVVRAYTPALTAGVEYDILWSYDATQTTSGAGIDCYINGSAATLTHASWGGGPGVTFGYNTLNAAGQAWNFGDIAFELGAFWCDTSARLDLSVAGNRDKFTSLTSGDLDILTLGDGITGSQPTHFHVGDADQWNEGSGMNRGSGAKFFVTSGAVSLVSGAEWV